MIELRNVTAGYGAPVLNNITAAFPPGQVSVIVGPNGSGKSTLLKVAAGLLAPASGSVTIGSPRARQVSCLPQSRLLPQMTAGRLVLHGRFPWLGYPRRYRASDYEAARRAMERLGVWEFAQRPLAELSGGTRQRCYIAMALCQDAPTILLDEPTASLDIGHQLRLLELCRALAGEGKAVVLVLHDLGQALTVADRLLVLHEGSLVAQGPPESVLETMEAVFGVRLLPVQTPAGRQFVSIPIPG